MTLETQGRTLVDKAKRILLEPQAEWARIDTEPATVAGIFKNWVIILAAIPVIAHLIGSLVFGYSFLGFTYRPSIIQAVASAITQYALYLVGVFLLALLIDALAPTFGGTKNQVQAVKVAAYSATASFLAGIFYIIPQLSLLAILGLYSLYLLYLGLPRLMKVPEDKAIPYTAAVVVATIVIALIISAITAPIARMFGGGPSASVPVEMSGKLSVPGGGEVDLGKLEAAAKRMEEAGKRMEASQAQTAVAPTRLQALLPERLGPYQRTEVSNSSANVGGMGGSTAEARYRNGDSNFDLKVSDIAAAGAIAALGTAFNVESSRQTDSGYEKTGTVNGRLTNESWDNSSKRGSYSVLVADRFMVEASGNVASVDVLKAAVNSVGLSKLEGLKS